VFKLDCKTAGQVPVHDEMAFLMERARSGEAGAVSRLKRALDDHPEIWRSYGDLGTHAQSSWVALVCGSNFAMQECLQRKVAAMRAELAGPAPTPLEKLLVERVIACWLQVSHADDIVAQGGGIVDSKVAEFAVKRQDAAHKRYLSATSA
jgi:hypothetical protein